MTPTRRHILTSALGFSAATSLGACSRQECVPQVKLSTATRSLLALSLPQGPRVKIGAAVVITGVTGLVTTAILQGAKEVLAEDHTGKITTIKVASHDPQMRLTRLEGAVSVPPLSPADRPDAFAPVAGLGVSPDLWPILAEGRVVHPHHRQDQTGPDLLVWSQRLTAESSGGPILNHEGQLVGLSYWVGTLSSLQSQQGLVLPVDQILPALSQDGQTR